MIKCTHTNDSHFLSLNKKKKNKIQLVHVHHVNDDDSNDGHDYDEWPAKRGSIKHDLRLKLDSWTRYEFFLLMRIWRPSSLTSVLKLILFCNCFFTLCYDISIMSSSHQLFDTHVVYLSSRKKKVQLVDIIIFVDTPISFVFKWDKRPLDGQKENAMVIFYTLEVLKTTNNWIEIPKCTSS